MSKKFTPTPYDAIFKQFLSEKETAKDFFDILLPNEIKALCDLEASKYQSTPDKLIAWRLMRYSMSAMQKHLDAGHKQLPLVFPIMFYSGEQSPHPYSTNWLDCFEDRKMAESIYTNAFKLADVTTLDDGEIMQHKRMALLTLIQKHIQIRDMTELMNEIVTLL
ncbi:ISNCY family transposase [Aphis craccivora]|uniref:ISNCY family transposase n=1 Tax=Aphis craccivora TaxID=307492 RepID=A0A6G0Y7K2_APHCR|nr:ISNCY family transposase [Aphis craccivora]